MSDASDRRAEPSRAGARLLASIAIAWTAVALITASATPPLDDERPASAAYAFVALLVRAFRFHVGVLALTLAAIVLARRARRARQEPGRLGPARRVAAFLCIAGVVGVVPEFRHAWPARGDDARAGHAIRVMSLNDAQSPTNSHAIAASIARERPDLIAFQQFAATTDAALSAVVGETYPHRLSFASPPHQGIVLYSRWPLRLARAPSFASDDHGRILEAEVDVAGRAVRVFVVHLTSPRSAARVGRNRREAATLVARLRDAGGPTIVVGDFNAPLGTQTLDAIRDAGLRHADDLAGWGLRWTWMPLAGVPVTRIDHVFASPQFGVVESRVLKDVGSDHRPIVVDLRLR